MKKHPYGLPLIVLSIVVFLGLVAFLSCILAEIKRTKKKDIILAGKLCSAPASEESVQYSIAALICLSLAQITGNMIIGRNLCCSKETRNSSGSRKKWTISIMFLVISWITFVVAVILISAATSMNKKQPYGRGWLDGECYVVKNGVFAASAVLALFTNGFMVTLTIATEGRAKMKQRDEPY